MTHYLCVAGGSCATPFFAPSRVGRVLFDRHVLFVDFNSFGLPQPAYINLVRALALTQPDSEHWSHPVSVQHPTEHRTERLRISIACKHPFKLAMLESFSAGARPTLNAAERVLLLAGVCLRHEAVLLHACVV